MAGFLVKRYSIDESAVQSYIRPGGKVYDILFEVTADTKRFSQVYIQTNQGGTPGQSSHVRSGRLLKGIQSTNPKATGPLTSAGEVRSTARHTLYFHDGVTGPITARYMFVPKDRGTPHTNRSTTGAGAQLYRAWAGAGSDPEEDKRFFRTKSVRGQKAKPFLVESKDAALAKQGLK